MKLKWWEDSVDEIVMGICVAVIACFAILKGGAAGTAVAGSAVSGLCVYIGGKQKRNGGTDETPKS